MKVNEFGMLMNLLAICAVSSFALLSVTGTPLSDEQPAKEIASLPSVSASNETVAATTESTKQTKSSENASVEESGDTRPPLEFPKSEDKVVPTNETLLKILQSASSPETNKSSTETSKLNETSIEAESQPPSDNSTNLSPTEAPAVNEETVTNSTISLSTNSTEEPEEDYDSMSEETGKSDVENIQDNNDQEDDLEEQFAKTGSKSATVNLFEEPVTNQPVLHSGHFALIFASTLIIFSVLAYVGLVLWRSRLEARYGARQRLVTEDVFYSDNQNDVRYFGL